jgi:hypothetical protein
MKTLALLKAFLVLVSLGFSSSPAIAGLIKYTYASGDLDWKSTFIAGQNNWQESINEDDGKISFVFSVDIDEAKISSSSPSSFLIADSDIQTDVAYDNNWERNTFLHFTSGKLILNPDKSVSYWDLFFTVYVHHSDFDTRLNQLINHRIYIKSSGGNKTCNCDYFHEVLNIITQRPQNTWIIASSGDSIYSSGTSFDSWSMEKIPVNEPKGFVLAALGLLGFFLVRAQKTQGS